MPIEAKKLAGGYGSTAIIQDINFAVKTGEWLSLIGANGSGKSTLLKLLCRILQPQRGTVILDGKDIHTQPPQIVAQKLAILPQQQAIPAGLTVQQLVSLGRTPHQPWWQWELLVVDTGQGIVEQFKSEPFWNQLKATQRDRVYVFDYYGLVNPGSIDKIEAACNQLKKALSGA